MPTCLLSYILLHNFTLLHRHSPTLSLSATLTHMPTLSLCLYTHAHKCTHTLNRHLTKLQTDEELLLLCSFSALRHENVLFTSPQTVPIC